MTPSLPPIHMDSEMSLSPLPTTQSIPTSPSLGPRKRSIHDVDGAAMPLPSPKRHLTDYLGENQENRDPTLPTPNKDTQSPSSKHSVSVEFPVEHSDQNTVSEPVQSSTVEISSAPTHPGPQPTMESPAKPDESTAPAAKKRKLSLASQQAKQQEKEVKERQRVEEKLKKEEEKKKRDAAREEEKRLKEEEKRKREAEREEERKQREEKKKAKEEERAVKEAAKEEEKRRKEEEKMKKERVSAIEVH